MSVITISREYGGGGRSVGHKAAELLGYTYVDKEILSEVAKAANVPLAEIERLDEKPESVAVRILKRFLAPGFGVGAELGEHDLWTAGGLGGTRAQSSDNLVLDEDGFVRLTREVIPRLADRDNIVILGRGCQSLLQGRPNVLHVRIVAPREQRVHLTAEREGLSLEEAAREVRSTDDRRQTYLKRHFRIDGKASELYHLVINTALTGMDGAANLVAHAARSMPFH